MATDNNELITNVKRRLTEDNFNLEEKKMRIKLKHSLLVVAISTTMATAMAIAGERLTATAWTGPTHVMTTNDYTNFTKSVDTTTGGDITFDLHIGGSLLPAKAVLEGIRDGVADVGNIISAYIPADLPKNNLVNDLAFTIDDAMAVSFAVSEMNMKNEGLRTEWAKHGVVFGGGFSTPLYHFACVNPVRVLADLKGKKVRTAGGSHVEWIKHVGGVPVSVPFTDVYTGLERGSIDCVMLDATNLGSGFKIWEVAKSVTMVQMGSHVSGAQWIYNQNTWSGLSDEQRAVLFDEMAISSVRRQMDYSAQVEQSLQGSWERGLERIEPDQTLSDELAAFKAALVENLPQSSKEKRGIDVDEAAAIIADFQSYYSRWVALLADVDRSDEADLVAIVRSELYKGMDLATYGL
jgi:TRAP-type C4-dicarboxylate transport system substrate-binding protein